MLQGCGGNQKVKFGHSSSRPGKETESNATQKTLGNASKDLFVLANNFSYVFGLMHYALLALAWSK